MGALLLQLASSAPAGFAALVTCGMSVISTASSLALQGPEFVVEFYKAVPRTLRRSLRDFDEGTRARVNRLISVWDERKVTFEDRELNILAALNLFTRVNRLISVWDERKVASHWNLGPDRQWVLIPQCVGFTCPQHRRKAKPA
jgi:hypothetical protein